MEEKKPYLRFLSLFSIQCLNLMKIGTVYSSFFACIGFIEVFLRLLFVNIPFWIDVNLPEILKISRLVFLYIFLQVLKFKF